MNNSMTIKKRADISFVKRKGMGFMKFTQYMHIAAFLIVSILTAVVLGEVSHHPKNAGNTNTRNAWGSSSEALYYNPALLGVERAPKGSLLLPPFSDYGAGIWSDKLAIRPYRGLFSGADIDTWREIIEEVMHETFDTKGLSAEETSAKLEDVLGDGTSVYTGFRASLLSLALNHIGFDVTTHFDAQVDFPSDLLMTVFSDEKGILPGNTLDFSDFKQEAIWATDLSINIGLPVSIPALHDIFNIKYGAGGIGLKLIMGHSLMRAFANDQTEFRHQGNDYGADAEITVQTAGTGIHGPFEFDLEDIGFPVNGFGIGVEIGGILYDDRHALSINVENLGAIFWLNDVKEATYSIHKDDFDVYDVIDLTDAANDIGRRNNISNTDSILLDTLFENGEISGPEDTLKEANSVTTMLPLTLNIGYAHTWDLQDIKKKNLRFLSEYITAGANYRQQFNTGPGTSFLPRLSLGTEFGTLRGFVPVRLGMILGGPERLGSAIGAGFNFRYFSLNASYKAVGHPLFIPKRGMEVAVGLNFNWGMVVDSDKDGIGDRDDACPFKAEDRDGFEDSDGCPEEDNDLDGILDPQDKCPVDAEDMDGFEDEDGCPDFDNDNDGVPDSLDKCLNQPEDKDNFKDDDGCPDFDNDGDAVPDSLDKCPIIPEDIDAFEDEDGCPDYDNDNDGKPDSLDNCIFEPEVYNGYKDDDGCPDTLQKPTEKEEKVLYKKLSDINFKSGSAELTSNSFTSLNFIVGFLKQYKHLRYEIQGHTDSQGAEEYNLLLSAARAGTVRNYLIHQGVADSAVIAIGYGEQRPIAPNTTAAGRARNRRVQFKIIETTEEYNILKRQQQIFESRVREAKIKGVGKKF